ncbi:MAG: hypothetical protein D6788_05545 [Planctomycetota bacterium]|nr:MAG: hypothetical protein D6788_05545 [Planctomycetota bacterium]
MFLSGLVERGATPALVKTLSYNEARLRMISENVANVETPGYRAKQLDRTAFQTALRDALERRGEDGRKPLEVEVRGEVATDETGHLTVTPRVQPPQNILFHDGTNLSLERQMADLAETGMWHDLAAALLRESYEEMRTAIRGRVS